MENGNNNGKVSWKIFVWIVGILTFMLMGMSGFFQTQISGMKTDIGEYDGDMGIIKGDIRELKTDVKWIIEAIKADKNQRTEAVKK